MMAKEIRREAVSFLKGAMLVLLVLFVLLCILASAPWILTGTRIVLTGWVNYPLRIASDVTIDWTAVATAAVALVLFTVGLHLFLKWFCNSNLQARRERDWRMQSTMQVVMLIVFAFVAGMSTVGIAHQISWLATTDEELLLRPSMPTFEVPSRNQKSDQFPNEPEEPGE